MNKKLVNHMTDIATSTKYNITQVCQYITDDGIVYVTDGARLIHTDEKVAGLDENTHQVGLMNIMERMVDAVFTKGADYTLHELPTREELKQGIKEIAGRKYGKKVVWSDGYITINARFLLKAMEALNADYCYVGKNNKKMPICIFENDDQQSEVIELILPVINYGDKIGFWEV